MHHLLSLASIVLLLGMAQPLVRAETPMAMPVDGAAFPATLTGVDASWQITLTSEGKPRPLPLADLVSWGTPAELGQEPVVVLADGSRIVAEVLEIEKERLTADSSVFGLIKLPIEAVAGFVFQSPVKRFDNDVLLDQVVASEGSVDRVILVNGDQLTGRLDSMQDNIVHLVTDVGAVDIKTDRIRAVVLNPSLLHRAGSLGLHAVAGFRDGSRLVAGQLIVEGQTLRLAGLAGTAWKCESKELVFLQSLGGRATYLSDLKAAAYRYVPYLTLTWPYHTDHSVSGSMLRAGGHLYLKGLGMHSASRLTYQLSEPYRRFQAEVAIDDATEAHGSVRFRVFADGREKFTVPVVRGGETPVPVSVDLDGVKRLDLVVEYADRADELDHADWLNARLIR